MIKKELKIEVDVYSASIHVFFVKDVLKFRNKNLRKRFPLIPKAKWDKAYALHTHSDKYPNDYFIILNVKADWGTIAHESFHCSKSIMDSHDIDDEEAVANLLQYIVSNIQKRIRG